MRDTTQKGLKMPIKEMYTGYKENPTLSVRIEALKIHVPNGKKWATQEIATACHFLVYGSSYNLRLNSEQRKGAHVYGCYKDHDIFNGYVIIEVQPDGTLGAAAGMEFNLDEAWKNYRQMRKEQKNQVVDKKSENIRIKN